MTAIQSVTSQPNQPAPPWAQAAVSARDLAVAAPVSMTSATSTTLYTPAVEGNSETAADTAVKNTEISTRLSSVSSQVTTAISNAVLNTSSPVDATASNGAATADRASTMGDIQQLRQPAAQPSTQPSPHAPDGFSTGGGAAVAAGGAGTGGDGAQGIGEDGTSPYPWLNDSGDTAEPSGDAVAVFGWQLPVLPPPSVSDAATAGTEDIGLAAVVAAIEEAARMPSRLASDSDDNMPAAIRKMANYLREEVARRRDQISDDTSTMVKINRNIESYYEFSGNLIVMGDGGRYSSGHFSVLNKLTGDLMYAHYGNGTLRYYGSSPTSLTAATLT